MLKKDWINDISVVLKETLGDENSDKINEFIDTSILTCVLDNLSEEDRKTFYTISSNENNEEEITQFIYNKIPSFDDLLQAKLKEAMEPLVQSYMGKGN